jgi:hypothetical protein
VNCPEIQERLSAYHDSELSPDEAAQVADHLAACSTCAEELACFNQISGLSQLLTDPPVPSPMWSELQAKLDVSTQAKASVDKTLPQPFKGKIFALAATFLVAVGLWGAYKVWFSTDEQHHLAMNFAGYLDEFLERPDTAQQILLAKYDGQPITLTEATKRLGYEPVAAKGLPLGYSINEVHLLKMPCCTCAQVLCTNEAGNSIAIFEHDIDQPVWFGDRPSEKCLCHEVPTDVKQIGNQFAATWKEGNRFITIIGATDIDEISDFVAQFKGSSSG